MLRELIPTLALVLLLAVAFWHPPSWVEATVGIVAPIVTVVAGALPLSGVRRATGELAPVVVFLAAILVVSECCRAAGVFDALGDRVARLGAPTRMLTLAFVVAGLTTVALSLDATVVLLTPVLIAATAGRADPRPTQLTCVRMANSASLLLPVSNLTNLLALPHLGLSFAGFAVDMFPAWAAVVALEYAGVRWRFRRELTGPTSVPPSPQPPSRPLPRLPLIVVAVMLAGFAVASPFGIAPAWVAVVAALVLLAIQLPRRTMTPRRALDSAQLPFAIFVLGLGVVVAAVARTWLGRVLTDVTPHGRGLLVLLALAGLGALVANLVNNLPATLLLVPLAVVSGPVGVLALLVGINVGSSLTWTGSLANLLWRRTLLRAGSSPPTRDFQVLGLVVSPPAIVVGVVVLWAWTGLIH